MRTAGEAPGAPQVPSVQHVPLFSCPVGTGGGCWHSEDLYVSERNQCPAWDESCHARKAGWDSLAHYSGPWSKRVPAGWRLWQNRVAAWWWWRVALEALPCHSSFPRGTMTVSSSTLQGRKSYSHHWIQKMKMGPLGGSVYMAC